MHDNVRRLLADIDNQVVTLYDTMEANIFNDMDIHEIRSLTPIWMVESGISTESAIDPVFFNKLVGANNNYLTNKILFWHDCEMLISALHNSYDSVLHFYGQFYSTLPVVLKYSIKEYEKIIIHKGRQATSDIFASLNSIFISLASSFDLITKISIELKNLKTLDFSNYPKLKSRNKLFGQCCEVDDALKINTVFSKPNIIRNIIAIRDEIIHNGTWDYSLSLYVGHIGDYAESWIFIPDFDEYGNFLSTHNRRKFYIKENRINETLPQFLNDALVFVFDSLEAINTIYKKEWYDGDKGICAYETEIRQWTTSFAEIIKKSLSESPPKMES